MNPNYVLEFKKLCEDNKKLCDVILDVMNSAIFQFILLNNQLLNNFIV
jgi:hypothetical protein